MLLGQFGEVWRPGLLGFVWIRMYIEGDVWRWCLLRRAVYHCWKHAWSRTENFHCLEDLDARMIECTVL